MKKIIVVVICSFLAGGCAIGQKTNYHEGEMQFSRFVDDKSQELHLGFYDERPYVLSGDKDPSFSGLVRSLYGIPYSRHTESGNPLNIDLTNFLTRSLNKQGYNAKPVQFDLRQEIEPVLDSIMSGTDLALVYRIREWKTDSMHREVFIYDITLEVYDSSPEVLASVVDSGRRRVNQDFHLGFAIKELLDRLNKESEIQTAINDR